MSLFLTFFSILFFGTAMADDAVVTIRHVEPDPKKEGVGVLVSVEDDNGNPKSFCSGDECKDSFNVSIASGKRIKQRVHEVISFTDYEQEGYATLILIDRSGSMGQYWDSVQNAARAYVDGMQAKDSAAIYTFNTQVDKLGNSIEWTKNPSVLKSTISNLRRPSGSTKLYKSLRDVLSLVKKKKTPKFRTIVLLTDAIDASAEGFGMYETIIRWSRDSKIPINVVGFTPDTNVDQENLNRLENLALDTKGRFAQVNSDHQIAKEFQNIQKRVHQTWIVKMAVCDFPAGWHDYRVVVKNSAGEAMGLDSTIYPVDKDIAGGFEYCGKIDTDGAIVEKTYLTTEDWPFLGLALVLVGGIAIGFSSRQNKKNIQGRDDLRSGIEGLRNQVNDLSNRPDVKPTIDSIREDIQQIQNTVLSMQSHAEPPSAPTVQPNIPEKKQARSTQMFTGSSLYNIQTNDMFNLGRMLDGSVQRLGSDSSRVDIAIEIDTISGHHANIYFQDGQYYIEDNNSTNGTFVNNQCIQGFGPVAIENNSVIQLGSEVFNFVT